MGQSLLDIVRPRETIFKRQEENLLMLEQYLAELEARYVRLAAAAQPADHPMLDEAAKVVDAYRAYRAGRSGTAGPGLPDWNEAFIADQLLAGLLRGEEARAELLVKLAGLKAVDPTTYAELWAEWDDVKDDPVKAEAAAPGLLVGALRAANWKNTQRWIVRTLGTRYAARLRNAFLVALVLGLVLVLWDTIAGPGMQRAALSGLGFAIAAGLLGASFSAMIAQQRIYELDNIEEARAATSTPMLTLRLGVGVAAAIIVYFFFESGLVDGALFPDLAQIGFGRITPIETGDDALRANAQAVERSAEHLVLTLEQARTRIADQLAQLASVDIPADKSDMVVGVAATGGSDLAAVSATNRISEKLSEINGQITLVKGDLERIQNQWSSGNPALGNLAPNADLSKLVVWCFAAGFTQTLVPSLLAKVSLPTDSKT
jgi:hypothetical protein